MRGTITVLDRGPVRIHTYTAPEASIHVTTHLLETPSRVIAVDAQVTVADADEVVEYARAIGKPLDRLIISHEHPDHFQGATRFGVAIHSLAVTRDQMAARGDLVDPTGVPVLAVDVAPSVLIDPGTETIDGVTFAYEAVQGGESADQLVIRLPEQGVVIAQDLVYHGTHVFVGHRDIPRWHEILDELDDPAFHTVLPGHGLPADRRVFAEMREYLDVATARLGEDGGQFKRAMIEHFPDRSAPLILDIGNLYLFGTPLG